MTSEKLILLSFKSNFEKLIKHLISGKKHTHTLRTPKQQCQSSIMSSILHHCGWKKTEHKDDVVVGGSALAIHVTKKKLFHISLCKKLRILIKEYKTKKK